MKRTSRLVIFFLFLCINMLFSLFLLKANSPKSRDITRNLNKNNIVFFLKEIKRHHRIRTDKNFQKGMSFFIDIKLGQYSGDMNKCVILKEAKPKAQPAIRFDLRRDGNLRIYWINSKSFLMGRNDLSLLRNGQWNLIGFVYSKGVLTTYINGRLLWEKRIGMKSPKPAMFHIFPGMKGWSKTDSFVHQAQRALMVNIPLSSREISLLYTNTRDNAPAIFIRILLYFILSSFLAYCLVEFLEKTKSAAQEKVFGSTSPLRHLFLLFFINTIFFFIFNLGWKAAAYFNAFYDFSKTGVYFFFLNIVFLTFLYALWLKHSTKTSIKKSLFFVTGLASFLLCLFLLSSMPRFDTVFPFAYNILFAMFYTFLLGSYDTLSLLTPTEKNK